MAVVESQMIELGTKAPSFDLPVANPEVDDHAGETRSLDDFAGAEALVVIFTCNHCPYAKDVEDRLIELVRTYQEKGVEFVAVCANDAEQYPDDSFDAMAERARAKDFPFPYLRDESQEVARSYGAECTPDFYVFDGDQRLAYRGRLDDGRPEKEPTTHELRGALDQILAGEEVTVEQIPSMGCNIKWKDGA